MLVITQVVMLSSATKAGRITRHGKEERGGRAGFAQGSPAQAGASKGHHHLRRHRRGPYPEHDALSSHHPGPDRPGFDRCGGGGRLDHPSPCPRSQGRAADARSRRLHAVPAPHQAILRRGHQHHHRRLAGHEHGGPPRRTAEGPARALLPQHGLDEFRHLPCHREDQGLEVRLGAALCRAHQGSDRQQHLRADRARSSASWARAAAPVSNANATTSAISTPSPISSSAAC